MKLSSQKIKKIITEKEVRHFNKIKVLSLEVPVWLEFEQIEIFSYSKKII